MHENPILAVVKAIHMSVYFQNRIIYNLIKILELQNSDSIREL